MKAIDRRKLFSALHRAVKRRAIELQEAPDAGSGSHGSLIFLRGEGAKPVRIVVAYSRDITPGVQRGVLRYLALQTDVRKNAADRQLALDVLAIFEDCLR